jgi:potassium uptake TrkH family protein
VATGLLLIAAGTLILSTPLCSTESVSLWEALFTATSALTVTGLSIIDVGKELTGFGQVILTVLIMTGGLGLMAITTFLQGFVQGRSGLRQRLDRGRSLDEFGVGGVGNTFKAILFSGCICIAIGTLLLFTFGFSDIANPMARLWAALFHSISAFNNAGFSLWANNLEGYRNQPAVTGVISALIVSGGLGWRVLQDLWECRNHLPKLSRLSLHTRVVLASSFTLILIGCLGLVVTERFHQQGLMKTMGLNELMQITLFQSITTRTAGFNTVPLSLESFSDPGILLMMVLMFIGASPGGTGGGIKTTTFAVLMGATRATLADRSDVVIRRRRLPSTLVLKAVGVTIASAGLVLVMTMLIGLGSNGADAATGHASFSFLEDLFTCISAFGTVGLDLGVTAQLDRWGQLVLVVGMFIGRIGILLMLYCLYGRRPPSRLRFPEESIIL